MFKIRLSRFILLLLLISSAWVQADTSFSRVFVFGDSLSDTGNLASVTGDLPPPFYMNRISNGPVAVELLADQLGLTAEASLHLVGSAAGSNYAVAGAKAFGITPIDLNTQIISFQANHIIAPSDALYVIFIGGNDIRDARSKYSFFGRLQVRAAAAKVQKAVESLSRIGAHSFLLVSAPNIGLIPDTRLAATNNPGLIERARELSELYQSELNKKATYLRNIMGLNIAEFDLFTFINNLVANADDYGFSNTTDACFNSDNSTFHPDCNFGSNFDQFIFFDNIHPTARVHQLVSEALHEAVDNAAAETGSVWDPFSFGNFDYAAYLNY